ncbi:MAG: hypothetical protein JNL39_16840 [Opitutaceae bacterium]|nr:hypothetical protein [Opitutaceae bacterium]
MRFLLFTFATLLPMSASDPDLHPLGKAIAPGEIEFTLRGAAQRGAPFGVYFVYRPYREWDVIKRRRLNLPFGPWAGYSKGDGLISTQREESDTVRREFTASGNEASFTVPLHSPTEGRENYQLAEVRLVSGPAGTLEFKRWFEKTPALDRGFGLACTADSLNGKLRETGLNASPLRGGLPLWPSLRKVDLELAPVQVPTVQVWESRAKHHWDGWRQKSPEQWPGGQSIVLRHIGGPTVWRENEYHVFPRGDAPAVERPQPPEGVLVGAGLEVFWPEGDTLEFPEVIFGRPVDVLAVPLAAVPARFRELLAQSVVLRPGAEARSLTRDEWEEMGNVASTDKLPSKVELVPGAGDKTVLKVSRGRLAEPWLCVFGANYDDDRRVILTSMVLNPTRWQGPLPE